MLVDMRAMKKGLGVQIVDLLGKGEEVGVLGDLASEGKDHAES